MLLSIVNGIAEFWITFFLLFLAGVILLALLQIDFILSSQWVILFSISSLLGLIAAIFAGVKHYRNRGKSQ
jgi:hypothetical protein